jgi:hypothetical protein
MSRSRTSRAQSSSLAAIQTGMQELKSAVAKDSSTAVVTMSQNDPIQPSSCASPPLGRNSPLGKPLAPVEAIQGEDPQGVRPVNDLIKSHNSFGDWLATFSQDSSSTIESDEQKRLVEFRRRKQEARKENVKTVIPKLPEGTVKLIICDLEKAGTSERFSEEIIASLKTPLYQIMIQLLKKGGFASLLGSFSLYCTTYSS